MTEYESGDLVLKRGDLVGLIDNDINREVGVIISTGKSRIGEEICKIYWFRHPYIEIWNSYELFLIKRFDRE